MRVRQRLERTLAALDSCDAALRLTLLLLLLRPVGVGFVRPSILLLAGAGLLLPRLLRSRALWIGLTALTGWRVITDWPLADNHSYLLAYWCLAVALGLFASEPREFVASNARRLAGLAFGFAALWKLLSDDYLDTTFFRVTLLVDPRFEDLARLVGGLDAGLLDAARRALWQHTDGLAASLHVPALPARFALLAGFLTWWTFALEVGIAAALLVPKRVPDALRHAPLLLFTATTFAVLPQIADFGWLLLALGMAWTRAGQMRTRLAYLAVYALLLVCREIPWLAWLTGSVP